MEFLSWIGWLLAALAGWIWSIAWLLLGGWVSTLLQILVIVLLVFAFKYGWRRAPLELVLRARPVGGWLWRWATSREPHVPYEGGGAAAVRFIRVREFGDVNLSTLLNVILIAGLSLLWATA